MWNKLIAIFFFIAFSISSSFGQEITNSGETLEKVNPDQVTDSQLENAVKQAEQKGYTQQQIEQAARLKGMSEADISKLRNRILEMQSQDSKGGQDIDIDVLREEFPGIEMEGIEEEAGENKQNKGKTPKDLRGGVFGTDIFRNKSLRFNPNLNIPTPKGYKLGTGDELLINIWGASEQTYQVKVSPEGIIRIPSLGPIYLNGLPIESASKKIISNLSRIYSGLKGSNINTYAEVTLSSVRSIKVTVIGEVENPGVYTLNSFGTIFHALYYSGGTSYQGTLRDIALYRNNQKIASLDVYDFLLNADKSKNVRLEDEDVIMVMPFTKRVKVKGEIRKPMLYDLKEGEDLNDLFKIAGGFTDNAYPSLVTVRRKSETGFKIITIQDQKFDGFLLKSSDEIVVGAIIEGFNNLVTIRGAILRGGEYELKPEMTLMNLIEQAEGLTGDAFLKRGQITRVSDDLSTVNISFNVNDILSGKENDIILRGNDVIDIKPITSLKEGQYITILGEVLNPITIPFNEGLTIEDVIFKAGGFTEAALRDEVEVARRVSADSVSSDFYSKRAFVRNVQIDRFLDFKKSTDFQLQPFDQIIIRKSPSYSIQRNVLITGEVVEPGYYTIKEKNEKVSDILKRAGGFSDYAYVTGSTLTRRNKIIHLDLDKIVASPGTKYDLNIETGDVINIPKMLQTVSIQGEVFIENVMTRYDKNFGFRTYITKAGGFSQNALKRKSYVIHANGNVDRVKSILFLKFYPNILPGSKIIIPTRPERVPLGAGQLIALATSIASMALVVNQFVK